MRKQVFDRLIRYLSKRHFLEAVFMPSEWREKTGSEILAELRNFGYPIRTETFYRIRYEIIRDLDKSKSEYCLSLDKVPDPKY
jgi:hypothetical protein